MSISVGRKAKNSSVDTWASVDSQERPERALDDELTGLGSMGSRRCWHWPWRQRAATTARAMWRSRRRPAGFEGTPEDLAGVVNDLESVRHQFEMTMQMVFEIDGELRGPDPTKILGRAGEHDGAVLLDELDQFASGLRLHTNPLAGSAGRQRCAVKPQVR
jgi:hypothetical protein